MFDTSYQAEYNVSFRAPGPSSGLQYSMNVHPDA